MRMWVGCLASLRGLRTRCCHELWWKSQKQLRSGLPVAVVQAGSCSYNSTPSLGMSRSHRCSHKKKKRKKKKKKKKKRWANALHVKNGIFIVAIIGLELSHSLVDLRLSIWNVCSKMGTSLREKQSLDVKYFYYFSFVFLFVWKGNSGWGRIRSHSERGRMEKKAGRGWEGLWGEIWGWGNERELRVRRVRELWWGGERELWVREGEGAVSEEGEGVLREAG